MQTLIVPRIQTKVNELYFPGPPLFFCARPFKHDAAQNYWPDLKTTVVGFEGVITKAECPVGFPPRTFFADHERGLSKPK
jgi:hypothetical protein